MSPCQLLTSPGSPDQHLGELHQVGVTEAAPAPGAALRVIVGAAVGVLTTLGVTLTREAGVIGLVTLARTGAVTFSKIKELRGDNEITWGYLFLPKVFLRQVEA